MNSIGYRPTEPRELVRAVDRISFVYLERAVINRDSNAITATDERGTVHIPAASVGVLLLGPGTTITHQAITLMSDSGSTVVWVGERGVRYYAHGSSLSRSSRLLEAQAAAVTNQKTRLRVSRAMYAMRFPDEDVSGLTMQQLRGREGARVRRVYRENAERTGLEWMRRNYDPENWDAGDPVNQALSAANSGFIHTGHHRSFVYDVADLYKAELTIPIAFDVAVEQEGEIGPLTRRSVRDALHDGKLLDRCARDVRLLLLPDEDPGADVGDATGQDFDDVSLWDEYMVSVPGGVAYGDAS